MLSEHQDMEYKRSLAKKRNPGGMPQYAAMIDIDVYQEKPVYIDPGFRGVQPHTVPRSLEDRHQQALELGG